MMQPTSVTFSQGAFLVEVEPDFRDLRAEAFVAHLSLLEDDGTVLRPLVWEDGDRVVLQGRTEPGVMKSALRYLAEHFGDRRGRHQAWHPHQMRWGQPVVVEG